MRERGLPNEVEIDSLWASGTISQRAGAARNRPEATYDPAPAVRAERARRGDLTVGEQDHLAADTSPTVRRALARNHRLSRRVLGALESDRNPKIRGAARARQAGKRGKRTVRRNTFRNKVIRQIEGCADQLLDRSEVAATRVESGLAVLPDILDEAVGLTPVATRSDLKVSNLVTFPKGSRKENSWHI